jgi:AraC family transcriptional regulator
MSGERFNPVMAEHQSTHLLVKTPLVRVFDVGCRAPRSGYGPAEYNTIAQIGLPRRGVFILERCGKPIVVDPRTAVLLARDDEYRVRHPTDDGDQGTVVILPPDVLEEATDGVGARVGRIGPSDHLAVCMVTRMLRDSRTDDIEAEDAVFLLLTSLSRTFAPRADRCRLGPAQQWRIEQARALLASAPAARWHLRSIGNALCCSPFHLARQFRAATGETISKYLLRLRLALAIQRLADGELDIAKLATDTGFAHHSHFTARFHSTFGITPTRARDMLTTSNLDKLRLVLVDGSNHAQTVSRSTVIVGLSSPP